MLITLCGIVLSGCFGNRLKGGGDEGPPYQASASQQATPVDFFPPWRYYDHWTYSDGYRLKVQSVDNGIAKVDRLDQPGNWFKRKGIFKMESMTGNTHRKVVFRSMDPMQLLPLKRGKQVKFIREFQSGRLLRKHETSWTVLGNETIEVPAGVFNTWVLFWNSRSLTSDWTGYEKWWYSPEVKNYVRLEYQYGKNHPSSRVLTSFDISP